MPPVAGTLISVSLGGAAIRFHGWIAEVPEPWLTALNRGDEVRLEGLIHTQTSCQIVTTEAGVLRVQFASDDAIRRELCSVVSEFTGPPLAARMSDRPPPGQRMPNFPRERSSVELHAQAAEYRELATTVQTEATANTLVRLATAFEDLAKRKEESSSTERTMYTHDWHFVVDEHQFWVASEPVAATYSDVRNRLEHIRPLQEARLFARR